MKNKTTTCTIFSVIFFFLIVSQIQAYESNGLSNGQTVYVPAYSHIYTGNKETPTLLAVTISIRNTDPYQSINLLVVNYYETQGRLVKKYIASPLTLNEKGATRYVIPQKDTTGGSGAHFIVEWKADQPVNPPIIETIMIGSRASFTSRGQVIHIAD